MDQAELIACEKVAITLALEAGRMIINGSGRNREVLEKDSYADLVTETDKAVEEFLFGELRKNFPQHKFMGEETSSKVGLSDAPTWVVDPIDGTMNFVHQFPFVCVSIALVVNKLSMIGIVYNPFLDQMYTAKHGFGAFCNGRPMRVKNPGPASLRSALITTEFGTARDEVRRNANFRNLEALGWDTHGIRSLGTAALNICSVASGYSEAYYEFGIHCWDMAAAAVIVTEAGGVVIDTEGGPLDMCSRRIIAACSESLAQQLSKALVVHLQLERD